MRTVFNNQNVMSPIKIKGTYFYLTKKDAQ
jgi:hypothetical protein